MIRISSGRFRGRSLETSKTLKTRPTGSRLRQAWLNSLQFQLEESVILDLFSGTGALGLEAISRGANQVYFFEKDPEAVRVLRKNIQILNVSSQAQVIERDLFQCESLIESFAPFDFIFMDPPYDQGDEEKILNHWPLSRWLKDEGLICVESAYRKEGAWLSPLGFELKRHERYGDSQLSFYIKRGEA